MEGLWSSTVTTPDHPSWRIEDQIFRTGPRVGYDHLRESLSDSANDELPLAELSARMRQIVQRYVGGLLLAAPARPPDPTDPAGEPSNRCEPAPVLILLSPHPFSIDVAGDQVVIRHEVGNTIRRIRLGNDYESVGPSPFGIARARFEGNTLVVESTGIAPMPLPIGAVTTKALRTTERYSPDARDPDRLEFELVLDDREILREPLVLLSPRVRIEGKVFVDSPCELTSGQFETRAIEP